VTLFDAEFIGIMGDDSAIRPVTQQFGVVYQISTPVAGQSDYGVTHTASSFLVDRQGRLIRNYAYLASPDIIAADMQQLLKFQ